MEASFREEKDKGYLRDYPDWHKIHFTTTSYDGYRLQCEYLPYPAGSNKFVILSHGYTYTRFGSVKYAHFFRKHGFNVVLYDNRGHGENRRTKVTLGVREARDLIALIDKLRDTYGKDIRIGLHGESMGAGIQVQALQYHPNIDFVICDCGFSHLAKVYEDLANEKAPGFGELLVRPAAEVSKLLYGFSYYDVNPIDYLKANDVPLLFMHGEKDDLVSPEHSIRMHEANKGYSELHLFPGSGHAMSWADQPDEYEAIEEAFLKTVDPALLV